jgi:hypothetical protein
MFIWELLSINSWTSILFDIVSWMKLVGGVIPYCFQLPAKSFLASSNLILAATGEHSSASVHYYPRLQRIVAVDH